jgi:hypothetical protein
VVFGGGRGIEDVGARVRRAGARSVGSGFGGAGPAGGQGSAATYRGRQDWRARRIGVHRRGLLGVTPAGAQACLALVLDLELDPATRGGLEGHGRIEEEAQEERQERAA